MNLLKTLVGKIKKIFSRTHKEKHVAEQSKEQQAKSHLLREDAIGFGRRRFNTYTQDLNRGKMKARRKRRKANKVARKSRRINRLKQQL